MCDTSTSRSCPYSISRVNFPGGLAGLLALVLCLGGALLLLALILSSRIYCIRRQRLSKVGVESKQHSEIPYSEIAFGSRIGRGASGEVFRATWRGTEVCTITILFFK